MEVDAQKSLEVISEFEDRNTKLREEVTNAKNKIEELENQVSFSSFHQFFHHRMNNYRMVLIVHPTLKT